MITVMETVKSTPTTAVIIIHNNFCEIPPCESGSMVGGSATKIKTKLSFQELDTAEISSLIVHSH